MGFGGLATHGERRRDRSLFKQHPTGGPPGVASGWGEKLSLAYFAMVMPGTPLRGTSVRVI